MKWDKIELAPFEGALHYGMEDKELCNEAVSGSENVIAEHYMSKGTKELEKKGRSLELKLVCIV